MTLPRCGSARHPVQRLDPDIAVNHNTAYERNDIEHLCRLDEFGLLLIEQPLPEDDIIGHAQLAASTATPVCLDESITRRRRR